MAHTVTNANVNTLAAAVASPYGPLTRVSDVEAFPSPNSDQQIEFTSALGVTVYLTYQELSNTAQALDMLKQQHDWTGVVADFKTAISGWNTLQAAMSTPHTYDDYQSLVDYGRANFPWMVGTIAPGA